MERGLEGSAAGVESRYQQIVTERRSRLDVHTDHGLSWALLAQWVLVIVMAQFDRSSATAAWLAWTGGAVLSVLPIAGLLMRRGWQPRCAAVTALLLWPALLTQFGAALLDLTLHGVLSLALLALYRDLRLLWAAYGAVIVVHLALWLAGMLPGSLRFLVEDMVWLTLACCLMAVCAGRGRRESIRWARCEAILDQTVEAAERQIADRTRDLRDSAERFRRLIENISAVPWELERANGRVVYLAPQFATVFGLQLEAAGRPQFLELFHRDDREPFRIFLTHADVESTRTGQFIDSRIMGADNRVVHVRSFVTHRTDANEAATVFGVTLDVTEQKRLEFELLQAQKLESIGQWSAGIAHEINAPTRFIGQNIRVLQEELQAMIGNQTRDVTRTQAIDLALTQALDGIDRIARIVEAMQEFSHPALEKTPHDLNRALHSTIVVASNEWQDVAEVLTDFDATLPLVSVLPGAFNQVMLNVLVNAAHAVAARRVSDPHCKGTITMTTRRVADWAEIRVRDTGCGIPEKIRERIFDPFFTTKPGGRGTGQGLAVAHDVIVKKHQGAIWAEPESPSGTTFIIRLPLDNRGRSAAAAA